jgi:hypothetical protein
MAVSYKISNISLRESPITPGKIDGQVLITFDSILANQATIVSNYNDSTAPYAIPASLTTAPIRVDNYSLIIVISGTKDSSLNDSFIFRPVFGTLAFTTPPDDSVTIDSITINTYTAPSPGNLVPSFEMFSACVCNTLTFHDTTGLFKWVDNIGGYHPIYTLDYSQIAKATLGLTFPQGSRYEIDITQKLVKGPETILDITLQEFNPTTATTAYFDAGKYIADLYIIGTDDAGTVKEYTVTHSFYIWCAYYICLGKLLTGFESACCSDCQEELQDRINSITTWMQILKAAAECDNADAFNKAKAKLDALCASDNCGCGC